MKKKVAIAVGAGLALVVVLWLGARAFLATKGEELREMGEVAMAEGEAFAIENDQEACVAEGLRRGKEGGGFLSRVSGQVFTSACLEVAETTPKLCAGVPERTQFLASADWLNAECSRRGYPGDSFCTSHLGRVQEFCHGG